jgi:hypothetical protein
LPRKELPNYTKQNVEKNTWTVGIALYRATKRSIVVTKFVKISLTILGSKVNIIGWGRRETYVDFDDS